MKRKGLVTAGLIAGLSVLTSMSAFAGEWKQDLTGWWYQNDDGSYPTSTWQWIDGDNDGVSESYYFDERGYAALNTVIDGYTVDGKGHWVVKGQIQTKRIVETGQFIAFTPYFNMDLHTFAKHLGYSDEGLDREIKKSAMERDRYTFECGGMSFIDNDTNTDYHYIFAADENGNVSNQMTFIDAGNTGLKGLMTGLAKEEYTASELEEIVKQAGATNIKKTEDVRKESIWGVSSNGGFVPTNNYRKVYNTKLEFDYNGFRYTLRNKNTYDSTPLISEGKVSRID